MREITAHAEIYVGLPAIDLHIPMIRMTSMGSVANPDATFVINIAFLARLGSVGDLGLLYDGVALFVQSCGWAKWNTSSLWQSRFVDLLQDS